MSVQIAGRVPAGGASLHPGWAAGFLRSDQDRGRRTCHRDGWADSPCTQAFSRVSGPLPATISCDLLDPVDKRGEIAGRVLIAIQRSARTPGSERSARLETAWLSPSHRPNRSWTTQRTCRPPPAARRPKGTCHPAGADPTIPESAMASRCLDHPGNVGRSPPPCHVGGRLVVLVQRLSAQVGHTGMAAGQLPLGLSPARRRSARCPIGRPGPLLAGQPRLVRPSLPSAAVSGRGLAIRSPLDSTASCGTPTSTPTVAAGRRGRCSARCTWQVNDTNQRPPCWLIVAARIRAVPCSSRRASFLVDSWVLSRPSRARSHGDGRAPPGSCRS